MDPMVRSGLSDPLQERLRRDGYLYLPGLLDPAEVRSVDADIRRALHALGWLAEPTGHTVAGPVPSDRSRPAFREAYDSLQGIEGLHRLAHAPAVHAVIEGLLEEEVFCHPAKIARVALPTGPDEGYSTGAHQDFVKLHVASDVLTVWIPLTPCTPRRQGLRVLTGSHRGGFLPVEPALARSLPVYLPVDPADPRWRTSDYALGDAVIFHSLTVHGGGPNTTDRVRLSIDVRYQRRTDPMRSEYAHPHGRPRVPDWPELCRDWSTDAWVRMPADVPTVPMPADVSYADYLSTLVAPPSRLLGY